MKKSVEQYMADPTANQDQSREIKRVRIRIADIVLMFCKENKKHIFTIRDLENYIKRYKQITPGSSSRILRLLRREGKIRYDVVNRRKSAYVIREVIEC